MFRKSRRPDRDFSEEIKSHIALEAERLRQEGLSPSDAETEARRQFGNLASAQERFYESNRWMWLDHLRRDVAYCLRTMRRNPGFTVIAVLSLALGIGLNALVFSVVNAIVLRPLPVEDPGRLVFLQSNHHPGQSFPNYRDLRDRNQVFSGLLAYRVTQLEMDSSGGPVRTWGYLATGNYFDVLGVQPALGRFFHQEDDLHPGASPIAVLSYGSWQSRFGGDRDIIGKNIRLNRQPYTVVGVAPRDFHGTEVFYWPEVWVPMMMQAQIEPGNPWLESRSSFNCWSVGRLKAGVTAEQAAANLNVVAADIAQRFPAFNEGMHVTLARPGLIGDALGRPMRAFSFGVLLLAGLVLLTACANLAGLIAARGADREREIAIRLSVGATKWRVLRQALTEAMIFSVIGGAAGYGLATALSGLLSQWRAPMDFPVRFDVSPDARVFLFATAVSFLAGILAGAAPARHAARTDANSVLKGEQTGWRGRKLALRDFLVIAQVALCVMLVAACQLSLRGLQRSLTIDLGFQPQGVSIAGFDLGLAGYPDAKGRIFQKRILETVRQAPGVVSAAFSNSVPLSIDQNRTSIFPEDRPDLTASQAPAVPRYEVSPGYFETMSTRLLLGRDFNWHDDPASPRVAIVNRAFGTQILHSDNPIGRRFRGPGSSWIEIVGMVQDGKYESLSEDQQPALFVPIEQNYNSTTTLIVRSSLPEAAMVEKMRQSLAQADPELPVFGAGSLQQMLGFAFLPMRAAAIALSAFGMLAVVLAITGIHGLVSYAVARRVREIGIRMAVGATPARVLRLVLGRMGLLMAIGSAAGIAATLAAGRILSGVVYGISPRDPPALLGVLATIVLLGIASSWVPARRAVHIDPVMALRHE